LEKGVCEGIFLGGRATARPLPIDCVVMPNASSSRQVSAAPPQDPISVVRSRADALYRAAVECCRQHDRAAKLSGAEEPELEHKHLDEMCRMCDGSLVEIADEYNKAAAHIHPVTDEAWWHRANALWHASREYARRHAGCDALSKGVSGKHGAESLASMQMEYELEASALLALRHAADAYLKTRPGLT
jgi:hypothetical protein